VPAARATSRQFTPGDGQTLGETETLGSNLISSGSDRRWFAPAGAVTGIGSLPLTSSTEAVQAIAEWSPEIPFWPQLPQLSEREGAIGQGLGILGDRIQPRPEGYGYQVKDGRIDAVLEVLHRSSGELSPNHAAGFGAFLEALSAGLFASAAAVKGHIEGPITLSAYLFHQGKPFLSDPALFAAVAFHVSQTICWQIDQLKAAGLPVLLFVDEPALCLRVPANLVTEEQRLSALAAALNDARVRGAFAGLHCCAARPFARMCRARPDILSFDAHEGLELFFADADARNFVDRGGVVAYGLVPTSPAVNSLDPAGIFVRWLKAASSAGNPQKLAQRSMVTATCGLGLLEPASIPRSFGIARGVGKLIRALAGEPYAEGS
jgi:hypothetical protein